MSTTPEYKYLVYAVYRNERQTFSLTRIDPIEIVWAPTRYAAITSTMASHKPKGLRPTFYTAARIIGPFIVSRFSHRKFTCEELLNE